MCRAYLAQSGTNIATSGYETSLAFAWGIKSADIVSGLPNLNGMGI